MYDYTDQSVVIALQLAVFSSPFVSHSMCTISKYYTMSMGCAHRKNDIHFFQDGDYVLCALCKKSIVFLLYLFVVASKERSEGLGGDKHVEPFSTTPFIDSSLVQGLPSS